MWEGFFSVLQWFVLCDCRFSSTVGQVKCHPDLQHAGLALCLSLKMSRTALPAGRAPGGKSATPSFGSALAHSLKAVWFLQDEGCHVWPLQLTISQRALLLYNYEEAKNGLCSVEGLCFVPLRFLGVLWCSCRRIGTTIFHFWLKLQNYSLGFG